MIRPGPEKHGVWPNLSLDNALLILGLLVARDFFGYGVSLIVNHEREQIVARFSAAIPALVDEYAQVSRQ